MAPKKTTIVFLPEGNKKVRQIRISRYLLFLICAFGLLSVVLTGFLIVDYRSLKLKIPYLVRLQKENQLQRTQLIVLTQKIDQISRKLVELKQFDQKLKTMVNYEMDKREHEVGSGIGGSDPLMSSPELTMANAQKKLIRLMHQSLENIEEEISIQESERNDLYNFFEQQRSMLAHTPSVWPTRGWVSSRFGYRISPFTQKREFHKGIDISARKTAPIIAPGDGIVSSVRWDHGYGKVITINHDYGIKTVYAHLDKALVKKGQRVKRGQTIALVGQTGRTTGPHLHYEVHLNGVPVNPLRYILE
ncbi:MAG: M23 family metallopeptidase [Deltaproteobacteria bacterium]|nr:M23 family metallopeptidase [Deltaproteobacteria bacterium]